MKTDRYFVTYFYLIARAKEQIKRGSSKFGIGIFSLVVV